MYIMKILITGASGLLGREIYKGPCFEHNVEGWAFKHPSKKFKKVNLLIKNETEEALKLNIDSTRQLAALARSSRIPMLFFL